MVEKYMKIDNLELKNEGVSNNSSFWGPSTWKSLHSMAVKYDITKKQHFINYINSLPHLLPCEKCGKHLKDNLKSFPYTPFLNNNHDLFFWTYLLHDMVNIQINSENIKDKNFKRKISPPDDVVKNIYFSALKSCLDCNL